MWSKICFLLASVVAGTASGVFAIQETPAKLSETAPEPKPVVAPTHDEVRTALESGQSLADLAVSKGKTAQEVIDAIVAEATTKLNTAVTDGKLTQAEADARLADITTHATEFVNITPPVGGPGFGRGFGGPGHHGADNDADDDAPVGATAPTDTTATTDTVAG